MSQQGNGKNFLWQWIAGIAIATLAAGGAMAWFTYNKINSPSLSSSPTLSPLPPSPSLSPSPIPSPSVSVSPQPPQPETEAVQIYWIKPIDTGSELISGNATVEKSASKSTTLKQALEVLLNGPTDSAYMTTIPQGTKLLGLSEEKNGIRVNLSQAFTTGEGPDLLMGRLAQIIYTATSLDPNAPVWIEVEGKPLEILGEGDGIIVDQPMTRQSFEENYQLSSP